MTTVLGAGISGLSAAYYLSNYLKNNIKLFESTNRVGGWINSIRTKDGAVFELGPRTLRCGGIASANTLNLIDSIGLKSAIVPVHKLSEASKTRLIYYNNQLLVVPSGIKSWFKNSPLVKPFWKAILRDWRTPKKIVEDESVYNFVSRRFGEDYAENVLSAIVCGVFAGDAKEISVKALMEDFFNKEQKHGGVIRGSIKEARRKSSTELRRNEFIIWSAFTFENGLETFPKQLMNYLVTQTKADLQLENKCSKLDFYKGIPVMTINDNEVTAPHLYCTMPSKDLAEILTAEHSFLKSELLAIPFVSVAVVNLEYAGDLLKKKGFGFLVPPNQKLPILGIIYDSCIYKQDGKTVLTVMMGGKWFKEYFGSNPDESSLLRTAEDHVKKILNIHEDPINSRVSVLKNCIPQYIVGHKKRVQGIREYIAKKNLKLSLIGNSYDGVGVHDAILSAKQNVEKSLNL